jgi:hypothetical protein
MKNRRLGAVGGACLVLAVGLFFYFDHSSDVPRTHAPSGSTSASASWTKIEEGTAINRAKLRQAFGSLDAAQNYPAGLQTAMAAIVGPAQAKTLDYQEAVFSSTTHPRLWVIPGPHLLCIAEVGRGAACRAAKTALTKGVQLGLYIISSNPKQRPKQFLLVGLVPDGVHSVRLLAGERSYSSSVQGNIVQAKGRSPIQIIKVNPLGERD